MDIDVIQRTADQFDFNVTRCGYAAFYQELGLADIDALVHCSRDHAMVAGFDSDIELVRRGTIMEGKPCCDFRFRKKPQAKTGKDERATTARAVHGIAISKWFAFSHPYLATMRVSTFVTG
jgi:hypothetical protein